VPFFRHIYKGIRQALLSGAFPAGERLPSTRDLAEQLGVSRTVVLLGLRAIARRRLRRGPRRFRNLPVRRIGQDRADQRDPVGHVEAFVLWFGGRRCCGSSRFSAPQSVSSPLRFCLWPKRNRELSPGDVATDSAAVCATGSGPKFRWIERRLPLPTCSEFESGLLLRETTETRVASWFTTDELTSLNLSAPTGSHCLSSRRSTNLLLIPSRQLFAIDR
jgi:hypothetical protein